MRILMLAPGQSEHAKRPLKMLLESGCEVVFMDAVNPLPQGYAHFRYLPYPSPRGKHFSRLMGSGLSESWADWSVVMQLYWLRQRLQPDLTHMHWISPQRAEQCLKAGMRPFIFSAWGSDINNHLKPNANILEKRQVGKALSKADVIIIDSDDLAAKCAELAHKPVHTVKLPLGVDTQRFKPGYKAEASDWRQKLGIAENTLVLLSIRGWRPCYGHQHILEAFAQAFPHFKVPAVLLFKTLNKSTYPEAEPFEQQIRNQVEALGLNQHVRWLEQVAFDQLPEIYAMSDVVLNYPDMDAFPVTFPEAAACERSVISVRLPAYKGTLAEHYFSMVEPGSMPQLTEAIIRFVNASEVEIDERRQLLSQARRQAEESYKEQTYLHGLLNLYHSLVQ